MSDIRRWLKDLGLGQYADAFEREDIDVDALRHLSDNDLKELGLAMGTRRKVLAAITELASVDKSSDPTVPREAERRQLTVMFCDLVGSTPLTGKLDPEDVRDVMRRYQDVCAGAITRFGGYIAQTLDDGLLVYFGWPRAHEDDAARAVRAGLDLLEAVAKVTTPEPLQMRIGIHTGMVVIGEVAASDTRGVDAVVGDTPNVAARLQEVAEPGEVLIGAATRHLLGAAFNLQDRGVHALKGVAQPMNVWRVVDRSAVESRFEATTGNANLTPFVGRKAEVAMLLDRWEQAKDGEGQVVLLEGEPGIGKSRITQQLRQRFSGQSYTRLSYQCSPYYTNSAFHPIIAQLERAAGLGRDDTADQKLDKLEMILAAGTDHVMAVAPLLAAILSLPIDRYPQLNLSPQRQKEKTIEALSDQLIGLARSQPVLAIFEDAHWADPTTLEALGEVIARIENASALLVVTYRPEFSPPWPAGGHVTAHTLTRLSRRQGADMVGWVTGGKPLPEEVLDQIVAKTDGVPLFVEELTKTVVEAGYLRDIGDHFELDGPLPPLAIPSTLQDSLMARLDRLSPVKEVAQIGSCIGREFGYDLLAVVSPFSDDELQAALSKLATSALVSQQGSPPDAKYSFKHALVQDAAHQSLLKRTRQHYHLQIAKELEVRFLDIAETQPELLAHHYTEGEQPEQAIAYMQKAGRQATERSANAEAISHFTKGLELLASLPETAERSQLELELQIGLGPALCLTKGYADPDVEHTYARARELCERRDDNPQLLPALRGLQVFHLHRGRHRTARELAEQFLSVTLRQHDPTQTVGAHLALGQTLCLLGELTLAREHLEQASALYDPQQHRFSDWAGGHPGLQCLLYAAHTFWLLGYPEVALRRSQEGLSLARNTGHAYSLALADIHTGLFQTFRRDGQATLEQAEAAVTASTKHGFTLITTWATIFGGWALAALGRGEKGIAQIQQGLATSQHTGAELCKPFLRALLAEAYGHVGQIEQGLHELDEALASVGNTGERFWEAELFRLKGEFLLQLNTPDVSQADKSIQRALNVARQQQAKSLELRAATSLARLWQSQGKSQEARDVLFPVYDWFTEGFDTADLRAAKALLDKLT